jgi:hypothetical protein
MDITAGYFVNLARYGVIGQGYDPVLPRYAGDHSGKDKCYQQIPLHNKYITVIQT